jgi:hypothetical protein
VIRGDEESGDDPGEDHHGGRDCPKHGDTTEGYSEEAPSTYG